jgi:hypothetical protein
MGKSTISMFIFNSFLYVYQAGYQKHHDQQIFSKYGMPSGLVLFLWLENTPGTLWYGKPHVGMTSSGHPFFPSRIQKDINCDYTIYMSYPEFARNCVFLGSWLTLSVAPRSSTLLYEMYMRHPNHLHDQYTPWWCIYIYVPIRTHIRLCKRLHSVWTRHWWLHWGMMGYDQTTLDQASMFGMWTAAQGRECSPVAVESGFFQAPHQGKPSVKGGNFPSKIGHHW